MWRESNLTPTALHPNYCRNFHLILSFTPIKNYDHFYSIIFYLTIQVSVHTFQFCHHTQGSLLSTITWAGHIVVGSVFLCVYGNVCDTDSLPHKCPLNTILWLIAGVLHCSRRKRQRIITHTCPFCFICSSPQHCSLTFSKWWRTETNDPGAVHL